MMFEYLQNLRKEGLVFPRSTVPNCGELSNRVYKGFSDIKYTMPLLLPANVPDHPDFKK